METVTRWCYVLEQHNREQDSAVQYSIVQYSTVQYSTVQYSTVQYSTVQYSTVLYSQRFSTPNQDWITSFNRSVSYIHYIANYTRDVCIALPRMVWHGIALHRPHYWSL